MHSAGPWCVSITPWLERAVARAQRRSWSWRRGPPNRSRGLWSRDLAKLQRPRMGWGHGCPSLTFLPPSISWQCLSWWNQVPVPWALSLRSFQDTVQSRGRWRVELVGVSVNHPDLKLRFFCWCEHGVKRNKPREWALPASWAEEEQAQRVDRNPCHWKHPFATNELQFITGNICRTISSFQPAESVPFFPWKKKQSRPFWIES